MSEELQKKFDEAVSRIRTESRPDGKKPSNEEKLKVYSLYKQATEGDVTGSQPWAVEMEKRAKWDAWNSVKGKDKETAMKEYVEEVNRQIGEPSS
mmetsp:Transcript_12766/g.22812  ORF Transcript_12766/g.22812 Transcript_12766/m.22812 type:complete len:95 (-) Transcript_12766:507-791(-)|eukprot:CAMPEP_0171489332 /NCGR_PEP_ID=MMETSP0958-20121227/2701_1 /TAXON_ID=87120 /ORGANISM="Aurantiochytrium limacinum, Strain ATCCMYA-1381" /LENGTH=94 /DNA_ID=CAMNT_0012022539 /DNA_START=384 /DNA_END=668 /DNA_ORIENTATION=+